jgi:hypothetical protein
VDSFTGIHVSTPIAQLICEILITFVCGDVLAWNYNPELSPDLSCNPCTIILLSKSLTLQVLYTFRIFSIPLVTNYL